MFTQTLPSIPDGTPLRFGDDVFRFGAEVEELRDSSELRDANDFDGLRARLDEDGFLFIRAFHPRELAVAAWHTTLRAIAERGGIKEGTRVEDGVPAREGESLAFFRDLSVSQNAEMKALVNGAHTFAFYEGLLGEPVSTFDKKWLRAMGRGGANAWHYDSAYVGRGTTERLTMWSALSEVPLDGGPLVLCLGSHRNERLKSTYGQLDMDRDLAEAVFSTSAREMVEAFGFRLATTHFLPGDALIFGLHLLHASAPNARDSYRISVDTRYQKASLPSDERFHGENGSWLGNFHTPNATYTPMSELRAGWGL